MKDRPLNVLFLCTHNSARSVIAETLLNALGQGRCTAHSAGSAPSGRVNPRAIELLTGLGYDVSGARSKSWSEFAEPGAPHMDFIFTVCDDAAGETCPYWPGHPVSAHWGIADPSRATGSEAEIRAAWTRAHDLLAARIRAFLALPLDTIDTKTLATRLQAIGDMPR